MIEKMRVGLPDYSNYKTETKKEEPKVFLPDKLSLKESESPKEELLTRKYTSLRFENKFDFVMPDKKEGGEGVSDKAGSLGEKFHVDESTHNKGLTDTVDLNSREKRTEFINSSTQLDAVGGVENNYGCAPACVVNGAMLQGGKKGLEDLVSIIKYKGDDSYTKPFPKSNSFNKIPEWKKLDGIETRINNNKVTRQDLVDLQKIVYAQMRHMENDDKHGGDGTPGIQLKVLKNYINTDMSSSFSFGKEQPLKNTFSNMNIKLVDTDANKTNGGEHFVLFFNKEGKGGENTVFDPWPRKDNNQLVTSQEDLSVYHNAVVDAYK